MAFIAFPNMVSAEMIYTYNSQHVENVLHFSRGSLHNDSAQMQLLAGALISWWNEHMKENMPSALSLRMIRVWDQSQEFGPGVEVTASLPSTGTAVSAALPSNVTLSIKLGTGLRGRSYRGRIYHVGISEADVTGDYITTAFGGLMDSAYGAMIISTNMAGYQLVVASKFHNGVPRTTGEWTAVTSVSNDGVIDSQRRRLTSRGQ